MKLDQVINGDCVEWMRKQKKPFADLIFADPPFNIGYEYDGYKDDLPKDVFLKWCETWIWRCSMLLKPNGSMFVAIGDDYAAELKLILDKSNLNSRNWIIWHYTFGVACKNKFNRSHTHIFYYVKNPKEFTFNADAIRVKSARQTVYQDKRSAEGGKNPDDTWVIRPQADKRFYQPEEDTWFFSRVCGTFSERTDHPCQMPLTIMERIIKATTNKGDVVFDPFAGSGSTLVAAKKLRRKFLGIEMSKNYYQAIKKRLDGQRKGLI